MTLSFPIGRVLSDLAGALRRNWLSLVLVLLVVGVVIYVAPDATARTPLKLIAVGLGSRALTGLMTLAITVIVLRDRLAWSGGPAGALRRAASILFTAIALTLLRDLPAFGLVLPIALALKARPDSALVYAIMGVQLLAFVWAFAFTLLFGGALAAAIAERRSLPSALARSFRIAEGRRVVLLGMMFGVVVVVLLAEFAIYFFVKAVGPMNETVSTVVGLLFLAIRLAASGLTAAFLATLFLQLRDLNDPPSESAVATFE